MGGWVVGGWVVGGWSDKTKLIPISTLVEVVVEVEVELGKIITQQHQECPHWHSIDRENLLYAGRQCAPKRSL